MPAASEVDIHLELAQLCWQRAQMQKSMRTIKQRIWAIEQTKGAQAPPILRRAIEVLEEGYAVEGSVERGLTHIERDIKAAAKRHPLYPFVKARPGLAELSLGLIIGELGGRTLSDFRGPRSLRHWFGLHVDETGGRDGRACAAYPKGMEDGELHGFKPSRKGVILRVAMMAFRHEHYHAIYARAKEKYVARGWDQQKNRATKTNRAHSAALRVVGQQILTDLWVAWRDLHPGGEGQHGPEAAKPPTPVSAGHV